MEIRLKSVLLSLFMVAAAKAAVAGADKGGK